MVEIERKTFTVTTTGVGRPDYSPKVGATKLTTEILQQQFGIITPATLSADTGWTVSLYVVPTGYKLHIGSLIVVCDRSIIQRIRLWVRVGGVFSRYIVREFRYDMRGQIIYGPESAIEVNAGEDLLLDVYNYDNKTSSIVVDIQGFIERVS